MKKVLITGANGFVGFYLAGYLQNVNSAGSESCSTNEYEVTAMVRHTADCSLLPPGIKLHKTDYSHEDLMIAFSDKDIIIHSAALVRARCWEEYHKINVELTEQIVEAFNECKSCNHLLFLSSQAASGMAEIGRLKTEEDACTPISDYGRSKRLAEHIIINSSIKPWTIIRPSSVYGPGDKDFLLFYKAVKKHLSIYFGKPAKKISFVYVRELAELINRVMESKASHYQTFFASDGQTYNQNDFIDTLQQVIPTWTVNIPLPDFLLIPVAALSELSGLIMQKAPVLNWQKKDELRGDNWVVSIAKAKSLLDFNPLPNLAGNLLETYRWYKNKGWL